MPRIRVKARIRAIHKGFLGFGILERILENIKLLFVRFVFTILLERKKEFLAEGFMYYDLVRTGKAIEVLGLLPHQQLLPIPNTELILNSNFTPNPGY